MPTKPLCHYIPEEVIEQIVVRIPCTKSILRCTLVCKIWYFLIKSSQFINTHLSGPNNTRYLLCHTLATCRYGRTVNEFSLYSDNEPSEHRVPLVFPRGSKDDVKVHGCCNGVICYTKFRENHGNIYLWNPFVRKLKILPNFRNKHYHKDAKQSIGFWFDKEKSDYEVVKITHTKVASSVDVYSLRSNSWKIVSDSCPGIFSGIAVQNLVYVKGTLYWLTVEEEGWRIVSLDMNSAKFREALISTTSGTGGLYFRVVDDNSLVILRTTGLACLCIVEAHDESLELIYTDSDKSFNNSFQMVGFRNNGEALLRNIIHTLFQLPKYKIVSYDFGAKQLTDFAFSCKKLFSVHPLVETLVLLDGR